MHPIDLVVAFNIENVTPHVDYPNAAKDVTISNVNVTLCKSYVAREMSLKTSVCFAYNALTMK